MFTFINGILCLFLLVAVIAIIVKKVLIETSGNYSGTTILIVIILSLIGLGSCLSVFTGIFKIEYLTSISADIVPAKTNNIISLAVGYTSLLFNYVIFKIIEKKNKKEQGKARNHWDLDNLK